MLPTHKVNATLQCKKALLQRCSSFSNWSQRRDSEQTIPEDSCARIVASPGMSSQTPRRSCFGFSLVLAEPALFVIWQVPRAAMVLRYRAEDEEEVTPPKPRNLPPLQAEESEGGEGDGTRSLQNSKDSENDTHASVWSVSVHMSA
ncbi:hypothetical protein AK812_SmicGene43247 [Symbiodinium microadriaticum]|uniref:Uncharacterized protein n=1 Tax=Symbiodinium microadriaticum TaxID=2951 RepID=A0A1Q9C1I0_SYMMI|nr:hypothetical protein AK812_SmicGene43247 [Symbiodinium microadriaticum]